jgi:hypothetical protein
MVEATQSYRERMKAARAKRRAAKAEWVRSVELMPCAYDGPGCGQADDRRVGESKSFSPSAALAISVETCRQAGLRRYGSGSCFSTSSRTSASVESRMTVG